MVHPAYEREVPEDLCIYTNYRMLSLTDMFAYSNLMCTFSVFNKKEYKNALLITIEYETKLN